MVSQNEICMVVVYMGKLPIWMPAFLTSCAHNHTIDWMIFTDSEALHLDIPDNVYLKPLELNQLLSLATHVMGCKVSFENPKKICDLKPIYGDIFSSQLSQYEYWGHCDLDIIWGDLQIFLNNIDYKVYDIISTRKNTLCGHFTLFQNKMEINQLYKQVPNYHKIFQNNIHYGFDEGAFSFWLYQKLRKEELSFKIFWPRKYSADWPELEIKPLGWKWSKGKILSRIGEERIYLHFMTWKKSMYHIDFTDSKQLSFRINRYGIWSKKGKLIQEVQFILPLHWPKLLLHYFKKIKGKIFLTQRLEGPIIPEHLREIS